MNRIASEDDDQGGDSRRRDIRRAFVLLSIPFALFTSGVVYLVWFSDIAADIRGVAVEEHLLGVRYAIEHTPPADIPNILAAVRRAPAEWDRRTTAAVIDLVKRSAWPDLPDKAVTSGDLLAAPPTQWTAAQASSVAELLGRFESAHPK